MAPRSASVLSSPDDLHPALSERLETTPAETTDDSPSGPLTFSSPPEDWSTDPSPSPSGGDGGDVVSPDPSPTSSPESSASGKPVAPKAVIRKATREGVAIAGTVAHQVGARDDVAREADFLLTDEDDQRAIGDPLANIAGRRSMLASAANPDVVDAIAAAIGLFTYAGKQLARWRAIRARRAELAALAATLPDTDAGEDLTADNIAGPAPSTDPTAW